MKIPTLLVVDDEPDWRSLYRFELEMDYEIREARNGPEALRVLESFVPDLMILDLMMPEMDGVALLREMERRGLNVPVILSTAVPLGEDPSDLLGHQVVAKSTNMKVLRRAIEEAFERIGQGQPA